MTSLNLGVRIKFFRDYDTVKLQQDVDRFCINKDVVNISYSTELVGSDICHCVCIAYKGIR